MLSNSEPLAEGTVIMADEQYAGRGQQGNSWHAEPGLNLTASIFLRPVFLDMDKQFWLNMAVCIGARNALNGFLDEGVAIKWPNDIYHFNRKLGGILIENSVSGGFYRSAIIGIGINVNQLAFNTEQVKSAVSLKEILHRDVDLVKLLAEICSHIEVQYLKLKSGNRAAVVADYLEGLFRFNTPALFKDRNGVFEGVITDVTSSGQLVVAAAGSTRRYNFKEIEFLTDRS